MLPTQRQIDVTAERIESLYLRKRPAARREVESVDGVWRTAATGLLMLNLVDPDVPVDPELFVTVQTLGPRGAFDPWQDLAGEFAMERYSRMIRSMVRGLRRELAAEVRRVERRVEGGTPLEAALDPDTYAISPLGLFIVAYRAGRYDLMEALREDAEAQHRACPLYHIASRRWLPAEEYPLPNASRTRMESWGTFCFSSN